VSNTDRFTGKTEKYVQFRPHYSEHVLQHLFEQVGVQQEDIVADIGAGTGIFTKELLKKGLQVVAVEPNDEMRQALIDQLVTQDARLTVSQGSAENTGLDDNSVNHIVCAQAFHWFDQIKTREEFNRILAPSGQVVLIWNQRDVGVSPFMEGYEALFLKYGHQYDKVAHKSVSQQSLAFFYGGKPPQYSYYPLIQPLDYDGLFGRIQSSSFSLKEDDPRFGEYLEDIRALFESHQVNGFVQMQYRTDIYWGSLS